MKRILALCLLSGFASILDAKMLDGNIEYAQNRFIVKLWPGVESLDAVLDGMSARVSDKNLTTLNRKWGVVQVERLFHGPTPEEAPQTDLPGYWRFWLTEPIDLESLLSDYAAVPVVEHVEPVGIHPLCYTPNDPSWSRQWYIYDTSGDHDIDAVEAWDLERGDTLAILGITDTGVQYMHQDLRGNIWRNWSEFYGLSGQDDDGNGLVDDSVGWDFVSGVTDIYPGEDGDVQDNDPRDFNGHGTHVAGIAAAQTNNGIGVAGIAGGGSGSPGARIMALRIGWTATNGMGYVGMDFAAQAINYARQRGACVINCSRWSSNNGGIGAAIDAAIAAGMVFCVAAGNDNSANQSYLASRGDCIDIAATNSDDIKASFSNHGSWVDVSAPGVDIYATYSRHYQNIYEYLSGTSMAAPCVTGEVGLLKSAYPTITRNEIIEAILNNVDNIYDENPGWVGRLGSGRINLNLALLSRASLTLLQPNGGEVWMVGDIDTIQWTSENYTGNVNITINRSYSGGPWENIAMNAPNTGQYLWQVTVPTTNRARIRVIAMSDPTLGDTSNADFAIVPAGILVDYPNGGESWCAGHTETIQWRGSSVGGTVTISLNRNFPSGTWETLFSQTANDGHQPWVVAGAASSAARIRIVHDGNPSLRDSSNANFTIVSPCIEVTSPQGGEFWAIGENQTITWASGEVVGNVEIAINRNYPAGAWDILFASTPDDHAETWTVTGPFSAKNRIRIRSIQAPSVLDVSAADFWIIEPNEPPQIFHDAMHDSWEPDVIFTAVIRDDTLPQPPVVQLFYKLQEAPIYSRTILQATGYTDEYAAFLQFLAEGSYEYYIRASDMLGAADSTRILHFDVGFSCEEQLAYDDGEGERFDWRADTRSRWAVRFTPPALPFALCGAQFGVGRAEPDTTHQPVLFEVRDDDGGLPGLLLYSEITGSVGNVIGGIPQGAPLWAEVVLRDEETYPILLSGDFFLIVGNPDSAGYEAFARDTTSENQARSFFFDPDESAWHNENEAVPNARPGNRLIRAMGYVCQPPETFALLSPANGDTVWTLTPTLDWQDASSANPNDVMHYVLYWSQDSNFLQGVDSAETDSSFYSFAEGALLSQLKFMGNNSLDDELPDDVTMYWKVRAVNWLGQTRWATPETGWSFVVFLRQPPLPFHLLAPPNETILTVVEVDLSWQATTDPDPGDAVAFYRVYLSENPAFTQSDSQDVTTTSAHWSNLEYAHTYWWRVRAYDTYGLWQSSVEDWSFSVASHVPEDGSVIPKQFGLEQNYPNPFNPSTVIRIAIPKLSRVSVQVYDILGQEVATIAHRDFEPGYHNLLWNCQTCAAGVYFVHMRAGEFVQTRKMLIVR